MSVKLLRGTDSSGFILKAFIIHLNISVPIHFSTEISLIYSEFWEIRILHRLFPKRIVPRREPTFSETSLVYRELSFSMPRLISFSSSALAYLHAPRCFYEDLKYSFSSAFSWEQLSVTLIFERSEFLRVFPWRNCSPQGTLVLWEILRIRSCIRK